MKRLMDRGPVKGHEKVEMHSKIAEIIVKDTPPGNGADSFLPIALQSPGANRFESLLSSSNHTELRRESITTMQINVGKLCNQACHHCHVDAGPKRTGVRPSPSVMARTPVRVSVQWS